MNTKKLLTACLLGTMLVHSTQEAVPALAATQTAQAAENTTATTIPATEQGTCGTNTTYTLTDGILTISGTGKMDNFSHSNLSPFYNNYNIHKIVIEDQVTSIGNHAFEGCGCLTEVIIGSGVTRIGRYAFDQCSNLNAIRIPANVTNVTEHSFFEENAYLSVYFEEKNDALSIVSDGGIHCSTEGYTYETEAARPATEQNAGETVSGASISKISSIKLVAPYKPYHGNLQTPTVIVKDASGAQIDSSYYTVTLEDTDKPYYLKNFSNSYTLTFHGLYEGTTSSYRYMITDFCKHDTHTILNPATFEANGSAGTSCCSYCDFIVLDLVLIPRIRNVELQADSFVYTGKEIKPGIVATAGDQGNYTIEDKYYSVTYSNNTAPGIGQALVVFKDHYYGRIRLNFDILPAKPSLAKSENNKNSIKLNLKTDDTITGYEIQISKDKNFSYAKSLKASGGTKKVAKLSKTKKNYVRLRSYKTVKTKNSSKKLYSNWSKTYTFKAK